MGYRVVGPPGPDRGAVAQPLDRRVAPGRRIVRPELRTADVQTCCGIVRHRRQAGGGAALHAVIEAAALAAGEIETVDHAGLPVGGEQRVRPSIESEPTERASPTIPSVHA